MNEVIQTMLRRRSCRSFSSEPVSESDVRTILDCALAAPSGMGLQTWQFTAVVSRDKIQSLARAVAKAIGRGDDYTMYNPDVLVITSNEKDSRFCHVDNACAMENIYLACESLGLGCVWINQLNDCCDNPEVRALLDGFGVPSGHGVFGCAAIGHGDGSAPRDKQLKGKAVVVR